MSEAFIVDAVRTPTGRNGGSLSAVHPADLAAHTLSALIARTGVDPVAVDDVVLGCVDQLGAQTSNIARTAWLSAGLPESVPGVTVDRQCGSAQQAIHFAAQSVMSGTHDLVMAGGVESMSTVPLLAPQWVGRDAGMGLPYDGEGWRRRYGEQEISQFRGAELIAKRWNLDRQGLEALALESHRRASMAWKEGRFAAEVVPHESLQEDEGYRTGASLDAMAKLPPLREGGVLTAATASQIADGSSALLIASEEAVRRHELRPLSRIHAMAVVGSDPVLMLTGPIPATARVLRKANLTIDDIDLFEVNEAFASVVGAWLQETGASWDKTNVNGGAMALGHPLGATGGKLMATLVHELQRSRGRYGLLTMCEGGGMANATVIERT